MPLQNIHPLLTQASPIPVGVITGWNVDASAVLQAGASFLLRKPFNLADLLQALQQELASQSGLERQHDLVRQFFAASAAGDWPRLARLCTPDLTVVPLGAPPLAALQCPRGLLVARPWLERRFHTLPGFTIEEVMVFARPQGVAARYTASWQSRDGVLHYVAGSMRFHFAGGRIAQIEGSF